MASFKAGAQVEAPSEGAVGSWYSGVVKSVKRDGTARVLFDESEEIAEVPVASCRPLPPEANSSRQTLVSAVRAVPGPAPCPC